MPEDIGASAQEFSTAVSIFYATYVLSETPWAILLKKLTPRLLLTGLAMVWSLVTIFSGFIQNIGGLYAARLILGACEGGLFPGLNLYLTMIYRREEQAKRVSYLFVCTAIAGAFGGLLAYGILHMDGIGGYAGWRWVYIIEGIFSVVIAIVVWFGLPNDPGKAYFLTAKQKDIMSQRQIQRAAYMGSEEFDWSEVQIAIKDPKVYISGLIQFCQDILLYGFSTFLPSIISEMGYNSYETQYLTVPVYAVGGLSFVSLAFLSDRYELRAPVSVSRSSGVQRTIHPHLTYNLCVSSVFVIRQHVRHHWLYPLTRHLAAGGRTLLRDLPLRNCRVYGAGLESHLAQREFCTALPSCHLDRSATDHWQYSRNCGGPDISQSAISAGKWLLLGSHLLWSIRHCGEDGIH